MCEARFFSCTSIRTTYYDILMQKQISESSCFLLSRTLTRFAKTQNNVTLVKRLVCVCVLMLFIKIEPKKKRLIKPTICNLSLITTKCSGQNT